MPKETEIEIEETPEMAEQRREVARILATGLLRRIRLDRTIALGRNTSTVRPGVGSDAPARSPHRCGELILGLARENVGWGVRRIVGELRKLALTPSRSSVRRVLMDEGLLPDPDRQAPKGVDTTWRTFLAVQTYVTYHNTMRPHQSLGNVLLDQANQPQARPATVGRIGPVHRREFLGGPLSHYERQAA